MAERVTVSDMMDAREARAQAQRALLARYPGASVVCLCMNIAGAIKRTENIERAFSWGLRNVKAVLAPCETLFDAAIHEKTGPEAMLCVRADARAIKRRLCALEDGEALGRLLDIDVIAPDGGKISRTEIGLPARRVYEFRGHILGGYGSEQSSALAGLYPELKLLLLQIIDQFLRGFSFFQFLFPYGFLLGIGCIKIPLRCL